MSAFIIVKESSIKKDESFKSRRFHSVRGADCSKTNFPGIEPRAEASRLISAAHTCACTIHTLVVEQNSISVLFSRPLICWNLSGPHALQVSQELFVTAYWWREASAPLWTQTESVPAVMKERRTVRGNDCLWRSSHYRRYCDGNSNQHAITVMPRRVDLCRALDDVPSAYHLFLQPVLEETEDQPCDLCTPALIIPFMNLKMFF